MSTHSLQLTVKQQTSLVNRLRRWKLPHEKIKIDKYNTMNNTQASHHILTNHRGCNRMKEKSCARGSLWRVGSKNRNVRDWHITISANAEIGKKHDFQCRHITITAQIKCLSHIKGSAYLLVKEKLYLLAIMAQLGAETLCTANRVFTFEESYNNKKELLSVTIPEVCVRFQT